MLKVEGSELKDRLFEYTTLNHWNRPDSSKTLFFLLSFQPDELYFEEGDILYISDTVSIIVFCPVWSSTPSSLVLKSTLFFLFCPFLWIWRAPFVFQQCHVCFGWSVNPVEMRTRVRSSLFSLFAAAQVCSTGVQVETVCDSQQRGHVWVCVWVSECVWRGRTKAAPCWGR